MVIKTFKDAEKDISDSIKSLSYIISKQLKGLDEDISKSIKLLPHMGKVDIDNVVKSAKHISDISGFSFKDTIDAFKFIARSSISASKAGNALRKELVKRKKESKKQSIGKKRY